MSDWVPLCMSAEEHGDWLRANARCFPAHQRAARPCSDCPAWFRRENLATGTCNGVERRPGGRSVGKAPKHSERRLIQWREAQARKRLGIRLRRSPVEIEMLAARVRALRGLGVSYAAIGRRLGIEQSYARDLALRKERAA